MLVVVEALAHSVPADWYYAHFPSISDMRRVLDAADAWGGHLLASYAVTGRDVRLREKLEPLADRKWDEVSPVERAILLIGAWELVHNPEIPYKVTINEAIELGKRFGGTDGHKYVNGVLDKLAAAVRPDEVAQKRSENRHGRKR